MSVEVETNKIVNRTYIYIFPMLGLANNIEKKDFKYFKGIFLKDEHRKNEENKLYLLLKFSGDRNYPKFEEKLRNLPDYIDSYDPDKYHTMFVFEVPSQYKKEFKLFCEGKYSQFSESYKKEIALFHNYTGRDGEAALNVLYKREQAYINMEEIINAGLPKEHWTKIPRDQEIGRLLSEIIDGETYHFSDRIKDLNNHRTFDDNN